MPATLPREAPAWLTPARAAAGIVALGAAALALSASRAPSAPAALAAGALGAALYWGALRRESALIPLDACLAGGGLPVGAATLALCLALGAAHGALLSGIFSGLLMASLGILLGAVLALAAALLSALLIAPAAAPAIRAARFPSRDALDRVVAPLGLWLAAAGVLAAFAARLRGGPAALGVAAAAAGLALSLLA